MGDYKEFEKDFEAIRNIPPKTKELIERIEKDERRRERLLERGDQAAADRDPRLSPVRDLRTRRFRACSNCDLGRFVEGSFVCRRPGGPIWDAGDLYHYEYVCSGWRKTPNE